MNYCYIIIIFWQILIRTSYLLFTYSFNKNANFKSDVSSQVLSKGVLKSSRRNMLPKFWSDDQTSDFEDGEQKLKVFCLDQVYRSLFFFLIQRSWFGWWVKNFLRKQKHLVIFFTCYITLKWILVLFAYDFKITIMNTEGCYSVQQQLLVGSFKFTNRIRSYFQDISQCC